MNGPKRVFQLAAIWGFLCLPPMYFMEARIARDSPPAITHPEYFYGFIGCAIAFQAVFWVVSLDPRKYRLMMIPAMIEKFSYVIAVGWLLALGRVSMPVPFFAAVDCALGLAFAWSFFATA